MRNYIIVGSALVLSNFIYQMLRNQDWGQAVERSIFQVVAVVAVAAMNWWRPS